MKNNKEIKGMFLPKFAIEKPVTVYMIFFAVIILGIISFRQLSIDLLPDFSFPMAVVITNYPGAGPAEIETMLTKTIESALSTTKDLKEMNSYSVEEFSAVMMQFEWGTDMDVAASDIREKIDIIKPVLPDGTENPMIMKFDLSMMPVMVLGVSSDNIPLDKLRYIAEDTVQPQLERLPGVAAASPMGGLEREIKVEMNRQAMESSGLSIEQVIGAIGAANLNLPGGHMKTRTDDYIIRTVGQFEKVNELNNIVVANKNGAPIYLRGIAEIKDSFKEKTSSTKVNGRQSVVLSVQKSPGANTVDVCNNISKTLEKMKNELPAGVKITTISDNSVFIKQSINQTKRSAVEGAFLAVVVILLFLRSISSTAIVSTAIPLSLITAFIFMYFGKMSLNIITLGGLGLGVGRLVDDAIVVIESIFRHRHQTDDPAVAAVKGTSEVSLAVLASTITTVVVFAPIMFVGGIAGIMFKPMAFTVVISLAASYFVAMVLIPLLSSKFLKNVPEEENITGRSRGLSGWKKTVEIVKSGSWLEKLDEFYKSGLKWALANKRKVLMIVAASFIITLPLIPFIGTEFVPASDEGEFTISIKLPVGTKLEKSVATVNKVEKIINENVPEMDSTYVLTGIEGKGFMAIRSIFSDITGPHSSSMRVALVPKSSRTRSTDQIVEILRKKFADIPDADINFTVGGLMAHMGGAGAAPITVEIRGYDMDVAKRIADDLVKIGKSVKGMREMKIDKEQGLPELQLEINRAKASSLGLSIAQIGKTVQNNLDGATASLYRDDVLGKEFSITVQLREEDRSSSQAISNILLTSSFGKQISLANIAKIKSGVGPIKIVRKNQERILVVTGQTYGVPPGTVAAELEKRIKKDVLVPSNFSVAVAGNYKDQTDAFKNLLFALLLAITLVYMVMAAQFESFLDPFIIMFSVPLGIIGVVWGLFLTGYTLSVVSFIGIIMMSGIVVSNAILLVDYTNTLRSRGVELEEAVITAGRTRLRPVLMTTLTTIVAMVPLALGIGEGSEMAAPMAISVVGGLIVSTVLTLLFIPTLYVIVERRIKGRSGFVSSAQRQP